MSNDWRQQAACRDDNPAEWDQGTEHAKRICAACPVADLCLQDALEHELGPKDHRSGLRAGTTPADRARIDRARRRGHPAPESTAPKPPKPPKKRIRTRRPPDCAEPSEEAFRAHRARGERNCAACLAEHLAYERELEDQQRPPDCANPGHRTRTGHYDRGELACRACLDWHAAKVREGRRRKRESEREAA